MHRHKCSAKDTGSGGVCILKPVCVSASSVGQTTWTISAPIQRSTLMRWSSSVAIVSRFRSVRVDCGVYRNHGAQNGHELLRCSAMTVVDFEWHQRFLFCLVIAMVSMQPIRASEVIAIITSLWCLVFVVWCSQSSLLFPYSLIASSIGCTMCGDCMIA